MDSHLADPTEGSDLHSRIAELARTPQLLVACDYDGTIAPLVGDPMEALPRRESVAAMRSLAALPQTHVAVISGRSLRDLAALSRLPDEIHLVGSHGSEFDVGFAGKLSPQSRKMRTELSRVLTEIADGVEGAVIEQKPASVAFHYRNAADATAVEAALEKIYRGPAALAGVHTRRSSCVLELSVIETNKGIALETLRRRVGASAVIFLGDDASDEDALATLMGPDVGVKVGREESVAPFRLAGPVEVSHLIAELAQLREEWLMGAGVVPVEQHTVLSDLRTLAVLTPEAQITWMCVPRVDSAALFADLVGGPSAGYFSIKPTDMSPPTRQRYLEAGMTVETVYPTFAITDYLDVSNGRWAEVAGRSDLVRVLEGSGGVRIEFAPRVDFGRVATRLEVVPDGLQVVGTSEQVMLYAPGIVWELIEDGEHHTAIAEIQLSGTATVLELLTGTDNADDRLAEEPRRDQTRAFWTQWAEGLSLPATATDQVRRSALLLKSLCHAPTGAMVAAGTSSLPEHMGGVRNWDYRYCWLRDAAWALQSLARLGSTEEGLQYLDWLMEIIDRRGAPERLQPLYNVAGHHLPPEADLSELSGYAGSRPVRIGNAAEGQVQLDVFGPIVDLVASLQAAGASISQRHFGLVEASVGAVDSRWQEPDHGIWEERTRPRHHVSSKVMCWVTVDRAIAVYVAAGMDIPERWFDLRDEIHEEVAEKGYSNEVESFTAAYGDLDVDASMLQVLLSGMFSPKDPKVRATVVAVESLLRDGPVVYRYLHDDGLPGREGAFLLTTSWLIEALLLIGETTKAEALFGELQKRPGPTGLMAEEYDPSSGLALGNIPQAYSHLGFINNALAFDALKKS